MKTFKEWLNESEIKKQKVCYMIAPVNKTKLQILQKSLNIKAAEIIKPSKFHSTIRFMETDKNIQPLLNWLNKQKLPRITATIKSFDKLNDAFVAKLDSPEMHTWFQKVNTWMVDNGYPKSDYDNFLPHISFSYETDPNWKIPKFNKTHALNLEFNYHYITAKSDNELKYKEVWAKSVEE